MTTPSRHAVRHGLLIVAMSGSVFACQAENIASPPGNLVGTYVLRSVNGVGLPTSLNGPAMTEFVVVADTIRLYDSGQGIESIATSRAGTAAIERSSNRFSYTTSAQGALQVTYPCADGDPTALASCIAPPHHEGHVTATGMQWNASALYRTPMLFERVDGGAR